MCAVDVCGRKARRAGLCSKHFYRKKAHGDPRKVSLARWTAAELARVRLVLDDTEGGVGRVKMGDRADLVLILGRSPGAVGFKLHQLRKARLEGRS